MINNKNLFNNGLLEYNYLFGAIKGNSSTYNSLSRIFDINKNAMLI